MEVYVVTNVEMGWDNVCGVFSSLESLKDFFAGRMESIEEIDENGLLGTISLDDLQELIQDSAYIIHEKDLD